MCRALVDLRCIFRMALLQQAVTPAEPVVRDGWDEVKGDVHVLAVDEEGPAGKWVDDEYARIRQPARVGVRGGNDYERCAVEYRGLLATLYMRQQSTDIHGLDHMAAF